MLSKAYTHCLTSDGSRCRLCGGEADQRNAAIALLVQDADRSTPAWKESVIGDVCRVCAYLGAEAAAARLRERASRLRESIRVATTRLERLADEVAGITVWASLEDLLRAEMAIEALVRGVPDADVGTWVDDHIAVRLERESLRIRAHYLEDAEAMAAWDLLRLELDAERRLDMQRCAEGEGDDW